ncbi:hypothetical protein G4B88_010776 [Cannabis sativa]|uniref:Ubiquitin-like protease family profile domain-containing protein n=1 Tax=Cannabis sativa TaxID=3483 RepID=A0A7J6DRA3_CANSA|nr:hypothetical protein G4B88_010776 [Cannabis sativa]
MEFCEWLTIVMRRRIDRDWMSADRLSMKYREGVDLFLEFAEKKASNPNFVHCPCMKCGDMERMKIFKIKEHLFRNSIDKSYDEHWMVILIQTGSQSVAFLDSKNKTIRQDIKRCVQTALERYYLEKRNRRSVAISFTEYRCPEQPDGNQCGYYSIRFIKSFTTENNPTRKLETEFKRNISSSYTNKEINEIRDEWAKK